MKLMYALGGVGSVYIEQVTTYHITLFVRKECSINTAVEVIS